MGAGKAQCTASAPQVDRVSYLLQEIYGIENKNNQETKVCPHEWCLLDSVWPTLLEAHSLRTTCGVSQAWPVLLPSPGGPGLFRL